MAEDGAFNRIDILSNENATYWNRGSISRTWWCWYKK